MSRKLMERILDPNDNMIQDILDEINTRKLLKGYNVSKIKSETNWVKLLEGGIKQTNWVYT